MMRLFLIIGVLGIASQGCVTPEQYTSQPVQTESKPASLPTLEDEMSPDQVRELHAWQDSCEQGAAADCLKAGKLAEKSGRFARGMRYYRIACAHGNKTGCALSEDMQFRLNSMDQMMGERMRSPPNVNVIAPISAPTIYMPPKKTNCVQKYNSFMRQYETVCETK